jgi:hypothetical protein
LLLLRHRPECVATLSLAGVRETFTEAVLDSAMIGNAKTIADHVRCSGYRVVQASRL